MPTIKMLLDRLRVDVPERAGHDEALNTATWAVAMQYVEIERRQLQVTGEARDRDHWTFDLTLSDSDDDFEVEVYGSRSSTVVTRVVWTSGHNSTERGPGA